MTRQRRSVVLGAALLLASVAASGTSAQSPEPSASPAVSPSANAEPVAWTSVDAPALSAYDAIEQAASTEDEVVLIATRCDTDGTCERVALASPDGSTWVERGPLPEDVNLLADLVADEDGLLIVGSDSGAGGAIWLTTDGGATWAMTSDRDAFEPGADGRPGRSPEGNPYDVSVMAVARGPAGLVAGGWLNSEDLDRSGIWLSQDGGAWERIRLPRAMDRDGGVFDVSASEDGYVAVTGSGLWRSEDGQRWTRATSDDADVPVTDVEATEEGFVGLGVGPAAGSVWVGGTEGGDWQRQPDEPALAGVWDATLQAFGSRVVAAGFRSDETFIPTVWTLEPGSPWVAETVSVEPGVRLTDVALIGDRLLVVGSAQGADETPAAAAWMRSDPAS
jgi:hypothetical protein